MPETIGFSLNFAHPLMMWTLLALSGYALFLGIRSKKLRTTKDAELRKQLAKSKVSQRHFFAGSLVLAFMVLGTFLGMGVTYLNNGKLFVGPHLLAGAAMACMIALAASLVPLMQRGNLVARKAHVGLNMGVITLFLWQALTGMEIVNRIWANR